MPVAHAVIEVEDRKYQRGDDVPEDLPGYDELVEGGAVSDEPYDPAQDEAGPPEELEIDGVVYRRVSDGADVDGSAS